MRRVGYEDLNSLCRDIKRSFDHLETRDAYGTEVELPRMAQWRRGEPDDYTWLDWWLEMLRGHRVVGRTCRRARVVSQPLSDYQRWTMSHVQVFLDAGEDIRYLDRSRLTDLLLPGSGDFYVFDDETALFLHYAGDGTNASFEVTDDPRTVRVCADAFEDVWKRTTPFREHRSE
jgi:hypothetical protein